MFLVVYKDMEWSRKVLSYEIGNFRHCATIFGTVRYSFSRFWSTPARSDRNSAAAYLLRRRIKILPPHIFSACGYCFELMQCENILRPHVLRWEVGWMCHFRCCETFSKFFLGPSPARPNYDACCWFLRLRKLLSLNVMWNDFWAMY